MFQGAFQWTPMNTLSGWHSSIPWNNWTNWRGWWATVAAAMSLWIHSAPPPGPRCRTSLSSPMTTSTLNDPQSFKIIGEALQTIFFFIRCHFVSEHKTAQNKCSHRPDGGTNPDHDGSYEYTEPLIIESRSKHYKLVNGRGQMRCEYMVQLDRK